MHFIAFFAFFKKIGEIPKFIQLKTSEILK